MSEPETPETPETETPETPEGASPSTPQLGIQGLLTRGSDVAARPGFRSPSNKKSMAMRGRKGKKSGRKGKKKR